MSEVSHVEAPPECYGRALFCEDIRLEASGQLTIVGTIAGGIQVPNFPFTLPKLCILIEVQLGKELCNGPMVVKGFLPGANRETPYFEQIHDFTIPEDELPPPVDTRGPYPGVPVRRVTQYVVSQGLTIAEPGLVQIRGFKDGKVYAFGSLDVGLAPVESAAAPQAE